MKFENSGSDHVCVGVFGMESSSGNAGTAVGAKVLTFGLKITTKSRYWQYTTP